jgi:hypothetical protein
MSSLQSTLGTQLTAIVGAILILVVGWFAAVIVRAGMISSLAHGRQMGAPFFLLPGTCCNCNCQAYIGALS